MAVRFADCTLDIDSRRVFRGAREVHLSRTAFELLRLLVESRPRAVSKADLLECGWPGVFVSDASLAKVVSKIRQVIGESQKGTILRTVHGYGYAFAASAEDERSRAQSEAALRQPICWLFCGSREFPLRDGEHLVGREPHASICLDSPRVSRHHARLVVHGSTAMLEDLGSKNGSFVRGIRISAPTVLEPGDDARIGPFMLVFRVGAASGSTQSEVR